MGMAETLKFLGVIFDSYDAQEVGPPYRIEHAFLSAAHCDDSQHKVDIVIHCRPLTSFLARKYSTSFARLVMRSQSPRAALPETREIPQKPWMWFLTDDHHDLHKLNRTGTMTRGMTKL